jgi:hypothetical protein
MMPPDFHRAVMKKLNDLTPGLTMYPKDNVFFTQDCKDYSRWPSIDLLIGDYWLQIHPKDYLLDATHAKDKSTCEFAFIANTSNFWLLGDSFYRGYYMIHDEENARIGFTPHATSLKRPVEMRNPA